MKGLQEQFLNGMRRSGIPATFYLINGFQMKGVLRAFDDYTMLVDSSVGCQMVFKHAISTIQPFRQVELNTDDN